MLACNLYYSGGISTSTICDRILGRLSALLRRSSVKMWQSSIDVINSDDSPSGNLIRRLFDGYNDHSSSEYCRLLEEAIINSKISLTEKAKSVAKDALQKVTGLVANVRG